jgi:WW domain-containing oxidoreductase
LPKPTAERVTEGVDLSGSTALVTGISSGIGAETMRVLAARGARVIGTARTQASAENACRGMPGELIPLACELTDPQSIAGCVEAIGDCALHMVIANAGIMALPKLEQVRGLEKQFATNHLGHFELITSLLENIVAGSARVAIVSSAAHMQAPQAGIEFDNLSGERRYSGWRAYGQSKLANVLFANELDRRTPAEVRVNSLHPGVIRTNLGRHMRGPLAAALGVVMWPVMLTIPQGAATSCHLVASPAAADATGQYFANCRPVRCSPLGLDQGLAGRLWEVSEALVAGEGPAPV